MSKNEEVLQKTRVTAEAQRTQRAAEKITLRPSAFSALCGKNYFITIILFSAIPELSDILTIYEPAAICADPSFKDTC